MHYEYRPENVCSSKMIADIENNVIINFQIIGGCPGNSQGVARLIQGKNIDEVIELLRGIKCRNNTSCPDQVAHFLQKIKNEGK